MDGNKYDFSGWATRNDLRCSDGRVIMRDAFKENNGKVVPLVWNHQHNEAFNVLGHALLENRPEGVYAYGTFNDTEVGRHAKEMVKNGDVSALSIYANGLKQQGSNVQHGTIREVSLVLAGANPGAFIDTVMSHSEENEEEAVIYTGERLELYHADGAGNNNVKEDKQMAGESDKTVEDVINSMNEEQKNVMYALIGQIMEDAGIEIDEESGEMKHNLFDGETMQDEGEFLSHAEMEAVISDAKRYGSLKESALAHGIEQIDYLFPEAQSLNTPPSFIQRDMGWVGKFMNAVHHTPFSRIKSTFADITEDDARARGYIKGKQKKDEVFSLLKRTTSPTTIYKKQKLDRDDVIDITDFDVVSWLKGEMRMMLDEEIARAALVGDGRLSSSDDKINESNVRPIWTDEDLYTIKAAIGTAKDASSAEKAKAFIRCAIKSRKDYKGTGEPTLYTTEDMLTEMLLLEDTTGRTIYDSVEKLRTVLRVKEIVTVSVMEGLSREDKSGNNCALLGIIVNPADYNIGADKGGAVNMFDDFDIDYNAQKYLIETRISGALIKPYSAIAIEDKQAKSAVSDPEKNQ